MYPNIIISFNSSANSMIGKLIIESDIGEVSRRILNSNTIDVDDKGKEFIDNYMIGNYANMGKKWFNLPGIYDLDKALQEKIGHTTMKRYTISSKQAKMYFVERLTIEI